MKTLNEALSNTLTIAKQIQSNRADVQSFLTNNAGLMTIPAKELCMQTPEQNNSSLIAKLEQSLKLSITITNQMKYNDSYGVEFVPQYVVPREMTAVQQQGALAILQAYMAPTPPNITSQMLGKLLLRCANHNNQFDTKAWLVCAAEDLSAFPADIVKEVVGGYRGTFVPAINELLSVCEALYYYRQKMKIDISRAKVVG